MALEKTLIAAVDAPGGDPALRSLALLHGAAVVGRFDAVAILLELARQRQVPWSRLEEAGLQVVAYGGFPRAIESLGLLARARKGPAASVAGDGPDRPARASAGRRIWDSIYHQNGETVLAELDGLVPGFSHWVLEDAYGRILSRPGLSLGEREMLAVAALALAGLAAPLGSHIRGALRSGFPVAAVEDILHACFTLADARADTVITQAQDRLSRQVYQP